MPNASPAAPGTPYDAAFYDAQEAGSLRSAQAVVPLLIELLGPASVLDVGCGRGTWLSAFAEAGVADLLGMDGDYVDRSRLRIPAAQFRPVDLRRPSGPGRTFDLALCLEVAEHLPARAAPALVELLTEGAPAVLFSAALPGQGGTRHINEQWPDFWERLFVARGFSRLDPIRPRIWRDRRVDWWYQQNLFLYARESLIQSRPRLREEQELARDYRFELVHERAFRRVAESTSLSGLLAGLPRAVWRAVRLTAPPWTPPGTPGAPARRGAAPSRSPR